MATFLTKGKTTRTLGAPRPSKHNESQPISGSDLAAAISAALHKKQALQGQEGADSTPSTAAPNKAITKAITASSASAPKAGTTPTAPAAPATQAATPLHKFPCIANEQGGNLLLTNVMQAKALGTCPVVNEHVAMTHDQYGTILLRMVSYNDGFLIGLIDQDKATYCECEFYEMAFTANGAWQEWLEAIRQ